MKKYKKYVITLSQVFPVTHIRKGEPTGFKDKFLAAIGKAEGDWLKLHTIRANYALWLERFDEIEAGKACLCIRQWTGKPYCSKQVEIAVLTKEDGIGSQLFIRYMLKPVPFLPMYLHITTDLLLLTGATGFRDTTSQSH